MTKKKRRKSAFVPRLLVPAAAVVSVVPAIAVGVVSSSCGSETQNMSYLGVAAVAYPAYEAGTDDQDAGDVSDAAPDFFSVAAVAYPAYEAGQG